MFSQNFRAIDNGVTFEQLFTGHSEIPDSENDGKLEQNAYRASGTLGIAFRRYFEGEGYTETQLPDVDYFFKSDWRQIPNAGTAMQVAAKWNIYPGMKPIRWVISDKVKNIKNDPQFAEFDIEDAMKKGVENWNYVFGFTALEAVIGSESDSPNQDDTNYIHFDQDPTFGYAFANWRSNPNTGEVRGASVYFSSSWIGYATELFADPAGLRRAPASTDRPTMAPRLSWGSMQTQDLCLLDLNDIRRTISEADSVAALQHGSPDPAPNMTRKEKVERYITHVVVHEIGHTLGLRHNFKGSLVPTSSSVMEYIADEDAIFNDRPGTYDIAAIKYLYGMSTDLPTDPFCNDGQVSTDPLCTTFDRTADPLNDYYAPIFNGFQAEFLNGTSPSAPNRSLNTILDFVRGSADSATRLNAWQIASAGVLVPVPTDKMAEFTSYGSRADIAARNLLSRLYIDPPEARGKRFTNDPALDANLTPQILAMLNGILSNTDGIRSFKSRRLCVDILKKLQISSARDVLLGARASIVAERDALAARPDKSAADQSALNDTNDLIDRLDVASKPYWIK